MYTIITDRIFWIYFIIILFFLIIGSGLIIVSNDVNLITITILWIISNLALLIIVYYAHEYYYENNRYWVFINALFIALLVIATIWAGELGNNNAGPLRVMSGILILLGGLILYSLSNDEYEKYIIPYWLSIGFLLLWLGFTLYVALL